MYTLNKHTISTNTAQSQRGFTLVELLVVIVILGVLATVGLGSFQSSQSKSRDSQRKSELKQIATALETYYNDKGRYPASTVLGEIVGCGTIAVPATCSWGGEWSQTAGVSTEVLYMVEIPTDPSGGLNYFYSANGSGTYYQLYARLENTKDGDVPKDASSNPQVYTGGGDVLDCGESECNYGVASSNTTPSEGRTLVNE